MQQQEIARVLGTCPVDTEDPKEERSQMAVSAQTDQCPWK